jgi:hypothetical protein
MKNVKKRTAKKKAAAKATALPTPEQLVLNTPIGDTLSIFYGNASQKDIRLAKKMYDAFVKTMNVPPAGAKTHHFVMAAVKLARVAVLAQAEHWQRDRELDARRAMNATLHTSTDTKKPLVQPQQN